MAEKHYFGDFNVEKICIHIQLMNHLLLYSNNKKE